jgi:hypothetical protein
MYCADVRFAFHHRVINLPGVKVTSNGIEEMENAPCGGYIASILDAEGFPVSFICGQSPTEPRNMPERLEFNDEKEKPRVRKFVRFAPGPAAIHKVSDA